ncbi:proto-oncogene tyrosine-protein kinase ROS [Trichogramma pretiosum]|uniref:proto-oncogene tyrosine-protein kinase ROS n=1 Tax=Trichogramma pretiosum TaxID=7493 RepID=UPI0006C9BC53|nr:proto-oncogene tyrosine-protein kinase ROS [Trichogramma pretiosum]
MIIGDERNGAPWRKSPRRGRAAAASTPMLLLLLLMFCSAVQARYVPATEDTLTAGGDNGGITSNACHSYCARNEPPSNLLDDKDDADFDVDCDFRCRIDHCSNGCNLWERAIDSSCQEVCNATKQLVSTKELYCSVGCQNALSQHYQLIRDYIGVPPTPNLVEDSLTSNSLTLKWSNANLKQYDTKLLYFAQCKLEDVPEKKWKYCNNQNWLGNNQISLYNLQPYAKYRFRLVVYLKNAIDDDAAIFSRPSASILTAPSGPPSSAPRLVKALAVDHSRIYVHWRPGTYTSGPLYSYVLQLQQIRVEIPMSQDTYIFQNLDADSNYTISLKMKNENGEGPAASTFLKTLPEPETNPAEKPKLIISSENVVAVQTTDTMSATSLFASSYRIRDVALHMSSSFFYVSDSADNLHRVSFNGSNATRLNISDDLRPWLLSVDWLNRRLYVSGSKDDIAYWEIHSYDLDGTNERLVVSELNNQPSSLQVDSVNGYLFWIAADGIYKVDLQNVQEQIVAKPEHIVQKSNLGAFIVDYAERRLLVAYQSENTIKHVSFDGKIVIDVRTDAQQPRFNNVTSLSSANGLFYWTNGEEIYSESFEPLKKKYTPHVLFNKVDESFVNLHTLSEESQPIPWPKSPPANVQVLVAADRAKITWTKPELASDQSEAAWQNWTYALFIEDDSNGEIIHIRDLDGYEESVDNLREHSLYTVRVATCSGSGDGPYSSKFKVQTLRKESDASILWLGNTSLAQSDLIGQNVKTVLNFTDLNVANDINVTDFHWYEDSLFMVTSQFKLIHYNFTSDQSILVENIASISNVAVEWITKKIYWFDPDKQLIMKSNFNGKLQEAVVQTGAVKKMIIDSLEAHVYWATSRTIEVARLNGESRHRYRHDYNFNGLQVSGLTLDLENRFVYWIVGDGEKDFKLYRSFTADMLPTDRDFPPELVSTIQNVYGPSLSYISERFFFFSSPNTAMASDVSGKFKSALALETPWNASFSSLTLKTPIPPLDRQMSRLVVRPEAVNVSSIRIEGNWRDFNVTWQAVNNTNYGRVFYEVSFADYINVATQPVISNRNSVSYANADRLLPYSLLEITVRAYTYWDSAQRVSRVLRSPQSVPSQPTNPRTFVEIYRDPLAEQEDHIVTFRWDKPEFANGLLTGYTVQCWFLVEDIEVPICDSVSLPISQLEYQIHKLQANSTYYFQVCASSEAGSGPYTDPTSAATNDENPVPQLLIATVEDVKKIDLDQRTNITITQHIAVEVAHLATESKIYWINEMQELVTANVDGKNITKILTLNNPALSLTVDWISRNLFWVESNFDDSGISHIMKLDISIWEAGILQYSKILSRSRRIVNLDIAPLTGSLFWMELSSSDLGYVMQSDLYGGNIQSFFNHTEDCSCPFRPTIQPVFTIDNTDPQSPVMYWISAEGQLYIADIEGCTCDLVLDTSPDHPSAPFSLTTDINYIYWSSMVTGKIYYIDKTSTTENGLIREYPMRDARSIRAIGKSLQPYPDSDCLLPQASTSSVQMVSTSANSITLRLPEPCAYLGCMKYNLPATLYTIDVTECQPKLNNRTLDHECVNDQERIRFNTYLKIFEATDLKPFTEYRFKLTLTNYYGDQDFVHVDENGPGVILKTGPGTPSAPENLRVSSLTPNLAQAQWDHSRQWNAEYVRYKLFWQSHSNESETGEAWARDGELSALIHPLAPGQQYFVHVRAYPENFTDNFSQSEVKLLRMHLEPNDLTLSGVHSDALNISWVPMNELLSSSMLEFTKTDEENWQTASNYVFDTNNRLIYILKDLLANEHYTFRLVLRYKNYPEDFVWPNDKRFTYQTLEDIPTEPGCPYLINLENSRYQVRWSPAKSLGSHIIEYFLEGTITNSGVVSNNTEWNVYYNGTENYWDVPQKLQQKYSFRVRAKNDFGFSNWSQVSTVIDLTEIRRAFNIAQENMELILGISIPIVVIIFVGFSYCLCSCRKKSKDDKNKPSNKTKLNIELATLKEIPKGNFIENNALYVAAVESETDDSEMLPKIQREQISLAKFLGSGAFGEVFQGTVKNSENPEKCTPVAVKTLRKGASSQEKNEFLQEAKLMSHFQHKHVLQLIGVCLDSDSPLLLLELMEGGDLLSYLRSSRSLKPTDDSALRLQDLLSMCEDVARGCRYLEELHFVHRDLACRNCLVSARDRDNRVVKIGDFGLARDIYKNDYYRKEGEGLLPVRWMAPESLVDGVFTSQSDVWAFGVIMWEITSLGQQPYQARTNLEVLHHVRAGGRLPKPLNCPPRLHQLMLRCWSLAETRPSFRIILDQIIMLRNSTEDGTLSPVNTGQFLGNAYKYSKGDLSRQSFQSDFDESKPTIRPKNSLIMDDDMDSSESRDPRAQYEVPKSIPVVIGNIAMDKSRYLELCNSEIGAAEVSTDKGSASSINGSTSTLLHEEDAADDKRDSCSSSSASLDRTNKKIETTYLLDKRSSTASLGDHNIKPSSSYAKLVVNRESVSSLSDYRRIKKKALDDWERLNAESNNSIAISPSVSYSSVTFLPTTIAGAENSENKFNGDKVQRSRSNLSKANIPLMINSGLLNVLNLSPELSDEDVNYANIPSDPVTDL